MPVDRANAALGAAVSVLKARQATVASDQAAVQDAAKTVTAELRTRTDDQAAHAQAVRAERRAGAALRAEQRRLRGIAVALYIGPPNALPVGSPRGSAMAADTSLLQQTGDAEEGLAIAETRTGSSIGPATDRVAEADRYEAGLAAQIRSDDKAIGLDKARVKAARTVVTAARTRAATAQANVGRAQAVLTAARQAQARVEVAFTPPPTPQPTPPPTPQPTPSTATPAKTTPPAATQVKATSVGAASKAAAAEKAAQARKAAEAEKAAEAQKAAEEEALVGGPTILGPSALSASQLVGWYDQSDYVDRTGVTISRLVGWYLTNGAIEGVRGDVAFAQAVHETDGFSSPDAVARNNYAGIGHCSRCAAGLPFATPEDGVIGQLQLLRSDAGAASGLPQRAVLAALDPADDPDLGCCRTWNSLTGKWASDPHYGPEIMAIYSSMLNYALGHPPVAPAGPTPPSSTPPKATPPRSTHPRAATPAAHESRKAAQKPAQSAQRGPG